jgi:hypothetical protein
MSFDRTTRSDGVSSDPMANHFHYGYSLLVQNPRDGITRGVVQELLRIWSVRDSALANQFSKMATANTGNEGYSRLSGLEDESLVFVKNAYNFRGNWPFCEQPL